MPGTRNALLIGVGDYENLPQLRNSAHDVSELKEVLENVDIGGFSIQDFIDPTYSQIREQLNYFFKDRIADDFLLLYYSGHGINDNEGNFYLAGVDTDNELLDAKGISDEYIQRLLDKCNSRKIVIILDCCYSGSFKLTKEGDNDKDISKIFDRDGKGREVLAATSELEQAWEKTSSGEISNNSIFTRFIIQGIKTGEADRNNDGSISVDEIFLYSKEKVKELTTKQTPYRNSDGQGGLIIARNPLSRSAAEWQEVQILRNLLKDAAKQYSLFERLISKAELNKLWLRRDKLVLNRTNFDIVLRSELSREEPEIGRWGNEFPELTIQALDEIFDRSDDQELKEEIVSALVKITLPENYKYFIKYLSYNENLKIRCLAAESLGDYDNLDTVKHLIHALQDESSDVRENAAKSLGKLKPIEAVEPLRKILYDENTRVSNAAVNALTKIGGKNVVEAFVKALRSNKPYTRQNACWGLGALRAQNRYRSILKCLSDDDRKVQYYAVWALGKFQIEGVLDSLASFLEHPDQNLSDLALKGLVNNNTEKSHRILFELIIGDNNYVSWKTINYVKNSENIKQILEILTAALNDTESALYKTKIVRALMRISPHDFDQFIPVLLEDRNERIRQIAYLYIKKTGTQKYDKELSEIRDNEIDEYSVKIINGILFRKSSNISQHQTEKVNGKFQLVEPGDEDHFERLHKLGLDLFANAKDTNKLLTSTFESDNLDKKIALLMSINDNLPSYVSFGVNKIEFGRKVYDFLKKPSEWKNSEIKPVAEYAITQFLSFETNYFYNYKFFSDEERARWLLDGCKSTYWITRKASLFALWDSRLSFVYRAIPDKLKSYEKRNKIRREMNRKDVIDLISYGVKQFPNFLRASSLYKQNLE